jgi:hypothetical protein
MCVIGLMALAMSATGPPATAQGSEGDAATLEALCEANGADEASRAGCLYIVHTVLVSGSGVAVPEPVEPGTEAGLGTTQRSATWQATLTDVDWDACTYWQPAEDHVWVAARFVVLDLDGSTTVGYNKFTATDPGGTTFEASYHSPDPSLDLSVFEHGHIKQGWVGFEVPEGTDRLEIVMQGATEDERLTWAVAR